MEYSCQSEKTTINRAFRLFCEPGSNTDITVAVTLTATHGLNEDAFTDYTNEVTVQGLKEVFDLDLCHFLRKVAARRQLLVRSKNGLTEVEVSSKSFVAFGAPPLTQ